ncbi:hypothetical protein T11_1048 [Trichinella zimbabwensis]|uniref:Uncharacterized protein n=1 Tax=Trichinella zimbabwensis TaxID=268475 RepID=A0A0V1HZL9_9BILA|nr:hypothetical protein T11_1048 [Trichinella zimbabwensis]
MAVWGEVFEFGNGWVWQAKVVDKQVVVECGHVAQRPRTEAKSGPQRFQPVLRTVVLLVTRTELTVFSGLFCAAAERQQFRFLIHLHKPQRAGLSIRLAFGSHQRTPEVGTVVGTLEVDFRVRDQFSRHLTTVTLGYVAPSSGLNHFDYIVGKCHEHDPKLPKHLEIQHNSVDVDVECQFLKLFHQAKRDPIKQPDSCSTKFNKCLRATDQEESEEADGGFVVDVKNCNSTNSFALIQHI